MKKCSINSSIIIIALIIIGLMIIFNIFNNIDNKNNKIEGFTRGFNWIQLINNTRRKEGETEPDPVPEANPLPLETSLSRLCNFPYCNTFSGVENNWNRNVVNINRLKNDNNDNDNNNNGDDDGDDDNDNGDNGNYRVIVPPKQFLSYNIISPACCQYTQDYTSSTGCVCLTPQQRQLLRFRYGNRS